MSTQQPKILIIGYGSSAKRFIEILRDLGCAVTLLKHRKDLVVSNSIKTIYHLKDLQKKFDGAIVSSPTHTHIKYLSILVRQNIPTLVDKPISDTLSKVKNIIDEAKKKNLYIQVGFNLRFLPIVHEIKRYLKNILGKPLSADFYVGQYLPFWRPLKKYDETYSASFNQGGGVALDLIHEMDLVLHLFKGITFKTIYKNKLSSLHIDTEDYVEFVSVGQPRIRITLDYLNHNKTRRYRIIGEKGSIECDIIGHTFIYTGINHIQKTVIGERYFDMLSSYEAELKQFIKNLHNKKNDLNDRNLGMDALRMTLIAREHVQK